MRVPQNGVRLDQRTLQYMQQVVDETGSVVLQGIPLDAAQAMRLSGDRQISLAVAQTRDRRYVVLVPTDLVPRDPALAPLFQDAQAVGNWLVLRLEPAASVAGALNAAGSAFGWGMVAEDGIVQTPASPRPRSSMVLFACRARKPR